MERSYLIRYGLMGQVGQFAADLECDSAFDRGRTVVIRSHRGTELGEVLIEAPRLPREEDIPGEARILRAARPDDLERARIAEAEREARFKACERVFRDGVWPLELVDVEPLLDDSRTVLHYLGPHRLDVAGLLSAMRSSCGLDVMLQPVGRDMPEEESESESEADDTHAHSCGDCGSSSGGCGVGGGCSDCGVKKLLEARG
jgi:cell fate regulator YaaT (PSP1 superfamily)